MAEACASLPSASTGDEGPVMDKHGDMGVKERRASLGKNKTPNGPSKIDGDSETSADPKETNSSQTSSLPNGCINHSACDEESAKNNSADGEKCDNNLVNSESRNEESDANNTAVSSDATEQVQKLSEAESTSDAVTQSIANVTLDDEAADMEGDGIQLDCKNGIEYVVYESERQMPDIMRLITKDLSEPYSIYTYRYFIHNWPKLCFLAMDGKDCVGAIVCKLDLHKKMVRRGYIAMLAIDQSVRRRGIGSHLVVKAIKAMVADDCDEVVLETEITNKAALHLYENLGFVRDKRLFRYYLNGVDALRLKLWLR